MHATLEASELYPAFRPEVSIRASMDVRISMPITLQPPRKIFKGHWQECYESFLHDLYEQHSRSIRSINDYQCKLGTFFNKKKPGDKYTRSEVQAWLDRPGRHGRPPTPATVFNRLAILNSFYSYAREYEIDFRKQRRTILHTSSPTRGIRMRQPETTPRAFSEEELRRFFAAIPHTLFGKQKRAYFLTLFWTARRKMEIAPLLWRDIEPQFVFDDGRRGALYRWKGKGRTENDSAELPPYAWLALLDYLEAFGKIETDGIGHITRCHLLPTDPVFPSVRNLGTNQPISHGAVHLWFAETRKAAGLPEGLTIHSLRHTAARFRHKRGETVEDIKNLLRHKSYDMTLHYLLLMQQLSDTGAEKLAEFANL